MFGRTFSHISNCHAVPCLVVSPFSSNLLLTSTTSQLPSSQYTLSCPFGLLHIVTKNKALSPQPPSYGPPKICFQFCEATSSASATLVVFTRGSSSLPIEKLSNQLCSCGSFHWFFFFFFVEFFKQLSVFIVLMFKMCYVFQTMKWKTLGEEHWNQSLMAALDFSTLSQW